MTSKTPVIFALFGLLAVAAVPASAQYRHHSYHESNWDGEFRLRVGAFEPEGDSAYWDGIRNDFTNSSKKDFQAPDFGLDYLLPLNDRMSLMFSGTYFEGTTTGSYRNFEDNANNRIRHDTTLDIGSATVGLVFHLLPRGSASSAPFRCARTPSSPVRDGRRRRRMGRSRRAARRLRAGVHRTDHRLRTLPGAEPGRIRRARDVTGEHDPIAMAKAVATLDVQSGGRFVMGVGFGWNNEEFEDIVGRHFRQPEAGLGFDGSPVAHMWRTMIWPNNFL